MHDYSTAVDNRLVLCFVQFKRVGDCVPGASLEGAWLLRHFGQISWPSISRVCTTSVFYALLPESLLAALGILPGIILPGFAGSAGPRISLLFGIEVWLCLH
jgi:hypothetical protein